MGNLIRAADFLLSVVLCTSQFLGSLVKTLSSAMQSQVTTDDSNSFDEFMCAFWFLALCGCLTKRRYIIVITTMAMFYSFVQSLRWAAAAHYSYLNGSLLTCTRGEQLNDPSSCKKYDIIFTIITIVAVFLTLIASALSSLRLWSKTALRVDTITDESSQGCTMISPFRYSFDHQ